MALKQSLIIGHEMASQAETALADVEDDIEEADDV